DGHPTVSDGEDQVREFESCERKTRFRVRPPWTAGRHRQFDVSWDAPNRTSGIQNARILGQRAWPWDRPTMADCIYWFFSRRRGDDRITDREVVGSCSGGERREARKNAFASGSIERDVSSWVWER